MHNLDQAESPEVSVGSSKFKLHTWMPEDEFSNGQYLGEIYVENGQLVVQAKDPQDRALLKRRLFTFGIGDEGIAVYKKGENGEFVLTPDDKVIVEKYIDLNNATPDEVISALYDNTRIGETFRVILAVRNI